MNEPDTPLIAFYRGEAGDHKGRTLEDIWALSPFWLEHTHDYVQWLFPIPEAGRFNGFAPLLGEADRAAFAQDETLRANQRRSLDVMLAFFGLTRRALVIEALPELNMREHIWLKRGGHNHLRISRIIRSLHLCQKPELAAAFQQAMIEIGTTQGVVSEPSVDYWRAANHS
ncbi:opioid growth factor receptor-related protein [Chromohalobacter canadensis]|uniref:opioid growth factor receptor-related protein n=1 Tax=Chromohalobacter canadensis TaxID=141389 RepID=UPI002410161A|nr:opioid growth factor receptor-related protein [Chromohalobacter canadensis]